MDVLLLVLVVALSAWGLKKGRAWWERHRRIRARATTPGSSADLPLVVRRPGQLEAALDELRCAACGGRVRSLGETPRLGLRVARARCVDCDEDVELYFVLPNLLN